MVAKNFRIGNFVKESMLNRIGIIESGLGNRTVRIKLEHSKLTIPSGLLGSIPLTEKLLFKCGYSVNDLETGKILVVGESFDNIIGYTIRELGSGLVIKTLDQLQNVYYFKTGYELDVKW